MSWRNTAASENPASQEYEFIEGTAASNIETELPGDSSSYGVWQM